jgi:outer membrane receptor for ferrienterochelin and colicin
MLAWGIVCLVAAQGVADEELFETLLDIETDVASAKKQTLRDSPGIVTVVTREEIVRSGARNLVDVLQLVPGFSFGVDVQGSIGVGVRGVWGQEGKVLVLFDGQEMNETLYLTPQFGNHYPIFTIERIEVIRGPGSAQYGGYAELGVVNIVSRGAARQGIEVFAQYGHMTTSFARANVGVSYGQTFDGLDGLALSVDAFVGEGVASDRVYEDKYGERIRMSWQNAQSAPTWLNVAASWRDLHVRFLADLFRQREQDHYGALLAAPIANNFYAFFADARYDLKLSDTLTVTPRLNAKRQMPWNSGTVTGGVVDHADYYGKRADRYTGTVTTTWDAIPMMRLLGGVEGSLDDAAAFLGPNGEFFGNNDVFDNGLATISYWNVAVFGETALTTPVANITAGARYQHNSQFGAAFVPRVALTKTVERIHAKLLVSGAFKPPGIENLTLNPDVRPELTRVLEGEVGYALLDNVHITANVFDVEVNGPIVYFYDAATDVEAYQNFPRTGSRGVEATVRVQDEYGNATLGYAYASTEGKNEVPLYDAGQPDVLRALPAHTLTATGSLQLSESLSVSPTVILLSERFGWLGAQDFAVERTPPVVLVHVSLLYQNLLPGLDARLGVYNLLDVDYRYLQPYDGGHAPLPASSREVMLTLTQRFDFAR